MSCAPTLSREHLTLRPLNAIHQQLCAFHVYSHDHTRQIESHHYCACINPAAKFHQCIIYDSDKPDARLIGIEYIVSEETFNTLPEEEKKYWHSHKYEVESGVLQLKFKSDIPKDLQNEISNPVMNVLHKTYGKTIHTWAIDQHPELPIGPPHLMVSWTGEGQADVALVKKRDEEYDMDSEAVKKSRSTVLDLNYPVAAGADSWEKSGKGVVFEPKDVDVKLYHA
ncbi:hypothetical protein M422DRAFT_774588 [Sphaerobolus stellatus SS14]|nr:hypothetical protein M422DRAFT_774588 [Sphaerobolus stellatus SS14]